MENNYTFSQTAVRAEVNRLNAFDDKNTASDIFLFLKYGSFFCAVVGFLAFTTWLIINYWYILLIGLVFFIFILLSALCGDGGVCNVRGHAVRGYYRRNGSYVQAHSRRPHRRSF